MVALLGCQAENLNPQEIAPQKADGGRKETSTKGVKFNGEYLEFKNHVIFNEFIENVQSQNRQELDSWEQKLGFKSMRAYYEQAIDENTKYYEWLRKNMTQELANEIKQKGRPHAEFVKKEAAEALVFDEKNNFQQNVYDPRLAAAINKEGFVQVGQYLFQYTADYIKVMPISNKGKIKTLKNAKADNAAEKITVKKIEKIKQVGNSGGRVESCTSYFYGDDWGLWDGTWLGYAPLGQGTLRRVKGSVHIQYVASPIYQCVEGYYDYEGNCTNYEIIDWYYNQTFTAHAQQWERNEVRFIFPITWEGEARTYNLSILSNVTNFTDHITSGGGAVANLYLTRSYNQCYQANGTVYISGDYSSSVSITVQ